MNASECAAFVEANGCGECDHHKVVAKKLREAATSDAERLRNVLEFYADPFAWKKRHDPDNSIQVPDFYSETSFGDTAAEALSILEATR